VSVIDGGSKPSRAGWLRTLSRQPFAIIGAFGLLSFAHDSITWQTDVLSWIDAWRHVSRPIVQFIFGWIPSCIHMEVPSFAKDYLSVGLVIASATVRAASHNAERFGIHYYFIVPFVILFWSIIWPYWMSIALIRIAGNFIGASFGDDPETAELQTARAQVFFEFVLWAAVVVAINFALVKTHAE
jgi:hypothetical protein